MFAARITLPHFSVSSATSLPKSTGDAAWMRNPKSSYFALISDRARDALISLLRTSTISAGIFLGRQCRASCQMRNRASTQPRSVHQAEPASGSRRTPPKHALGPPDLWNRIGRGCELHLHLTADNIRQGECDATIWHVDYVNT